MHSPLYYNPASLLMIEIIEVTYAIRKILHRFSELEHRYYVSLNIYIYMISSFLANAKKYNPPISSAVKCLLCRCLKSYLAVAFNLIVSLYSYVCELNCRIFIFCGFLLSNATMPRYCLSIHLNI